MHTWLLLGLTFTFFLYICEHIILSMDFLKMSEAHTINLVYLCYKLYSFFVFVRVFCERIVLLTLCSPIKEFSKPFRW